MEHSKPVAILALASTSSGSRRLFASLRWPKYASCPPHNHLARREGPTTSCVRRDDGDLRPSREEEGQRATEQRKGALFPPRARVGRWSRLRPCFATIGREGDAPEKRHRRRGGRPVSLISPHAP